MNIKEFIIVFIFFSTFFSLEAGTKGSAEDYLMEIRALADNPLKQDEALLNLFSEALRYYPDSSDLYVERAYYYLGKKEYQLALADYLKADSLGYDNQSYLWQNVSMVYSYQGDYKKALAYAKKAVESSPLDERASSDLLWLYQKNFMLEKGVEEGLSMLINFPHSSMINANLANLYSSLYDYEKSSFYFNKAISSALHENMLELASINFYNQYLLEMKFNHYEKAEYCLEQALSLTENASVFYILGEFRAEQLQYQEALEAFNKSEELEFYNQKEYGDSRTPLSRLAMAGLFIDFGEFDKAKTALDEVAKFKNVDWMVNYGLNENVHQSVVYNYYERLWALKKKQLKKTLHFQWLDYFKTIGHRLEAAFYQFYYGNKAKAYALRTGTEFLQTNNKLSAYELFTQAVKEHRRQERFFLEQAAALEYALIKQESVRNKASLAINSKNKEELVKAYLAFDPVYEKRSKALALAALVKMEHSKKRAKQYLEDLYTYLPQEVAPYGLPLSLSVKGPDKEVKKLKKLLAQVFQLEKSRSRYHLDLVMDDQIYLVLYDQAEVVFSDSLEYTKQYKLDELALTITQRMYQP